MIYVYSKNITIIALHAEFIKIKQKQKFKKKVYAFW